MNEQRSLLDERLFQNEQRSLSTNIMHSLVNLTVQHHNAHKITHILPAHLALEISESDFSGVDSLIRDAHQFINFSKNENGLLIELSFDKISHLMKNIQKVKKQNKLLIEYLHKGASTPCLHDLFHISKIQVVGLRKKYSLTTSASGRKDFEAMFDAKAEYERIVTNTSDLKTDLLKVSESLGIPLNTVWHAVRNPDYAEEVGGQKLCKTATN